jgi:hypothetical protein
MLRSGKTTESVESVIDICSFARLITQASWCVLSYSQDILLQSL